MKHRSLIAALALLATLTCGRALAGACDDGGIGGTGVTADGGIGGTGIRPGAEIALLGAITGFGSICVNGVEVHYDPATPVSTNGQPSSAADLALGQVVAVRAVAERGSIVARSILVADAALGKVAADAAPGYVRVGAERVRLEADTVFGPGVDRANIAGARDEKVRVSGFHDSQGTLVATRIERARERDAEPAGPPALPATGPQSRFIVEGYAGRRQDGELQIGGARYRLEAGHTEPRENQLVRAHGRTEADGTHVIERTEVMRRALDSRPERSAPSRDQGKDRGEGRDRGDGRERGDSRGRPERPERLDRTDRVERPERVERPDRSGRH